MGIYDRDYYRGADRRLLSGGGQSVLWTILAINVAVYVLQILSGPVGGLTELLDLDPRKVIGQFQIWRLLTYGFCHNQFDVLHIVFNMLFLFWFGGELERMYGSGEFLRFYLTAIVASGLAYLGLAVVLGTTNPSIGASGGVMAVTILYAIYFPRRVILLFFVFPIEIRWLVLFYVIYDLHPVLQALGGVPQQSHVAHSAHLGGLAYGFLYYYFDLRFTRLFSGLLGRWRFVWSGRKKRAAERNLRIHVEPEESEAQTDLSQQVDAILEKISAQGESSLNDEERQILIEASRRYRNRRGHNLN